MRNLSKLGWVIGIIAVAVGFGLSVGWWLSQQGTVPELPKEPGVNAIVSATNTVPPAPPTPAPAKTNVVVAETNDDVMAPEPAPVPTYEDKLEQILLTDGTEAQKSQQILDLLRATPDEQAKVELSQHLVNMTLDDNYHGAAELLTNATTSSEVSQVLLNDLLNRNNHLKLPMLLSVASNEEHPLKGEAREMLELFLQEDKGTNWADWDTSIKAWLKENEPEEAAAADNSAANATVQ